MRYTSAFRRSESYTNFFRLLRLVVLFAPPLILLFSYSQQTDPAKQAEILKATPWMTLLGLVVSWLLWRFYQRTLTLEVEIDAEGIRHLRPGKPRTLRWSEITSARVIKVNNNERALVVKSPAGKYLFMTHLVPDSPAAPELRFRLRGPLWVYPDGRVVRATVENSFGYQAVQQYRPDLLLATNPVKPTA